MITRRFALSLLFAIIFGLGLFDGVDAETVTNQDIVEMHKAGLSDEVIINHIEQAPSWDFDLTTPAIIELSKLGVSSEVIAAMQRFDQKDTSPSKAVSDSEGGDEAEEASEVERMAESQPTSSPQSAPSQVVNPFSHMTPTLIADEERLTMYAVGRMNSRIGAGAMVPFSRKKPKFVIAGSNARLRIKDHRPIFEVSLATNYHPEDSIALVRVESKGDNRLFAFDPRGNRGVGFIGLVPRKNKIPLTLEELSETAPGGLKRVRITLRDLLDSGEYIIMVSHQSFDFAVEE